MRYLKKIKYAILAETDIAILRNKDTFTVKLPLLRKYSDLIYTWYEVIAVRNKGEYGHIRLSDNPQWAKNKPQQVQKIKQILTIV